MNADSTSSSNRPLPLRILRRVWEWALVFEGSTRSSALIRIAIVVCLWTRWGNRFGFLTDPSWPMLGLGLAFYGSTLLAFIGLWTRPACVVAGAVTVYGHYYLGLTELHTGWTNHHMRLLTISTVLLALIPCGRSYSVDRWLAVRRARREGREPPAERGDLWGLRIMAIFLMSLYVSTAYHKTMMPWLSGMRMEQIFGAHFLGSYYLDERWWTLTMQALALGTWALEWFLPFGLWFRRTRRWAVISGMLMHSLFFAFFEVYTFSTNMMVLYLAFIPPQAVHDCIDRLLGPTPPASKQSAEPSTPRSLVPMYLASAAAGLFLIYMALWRGTEPRDSIHPSSATFVSLELRPLDDPSSPPIDWDALFDAREKKQKKRTPWPPHIRRIASEKEIPSATSKVCAHVDRDVQLVARARLATPDGWVELETRDGDVCRRRPQPKSNTKARPKVQATNSGGSR